MRDEAALGAQSEGAPLSQRDQVCGHAPAWAVHLSRSSELSTFAQALHLLRLGACPGTTSERVLLPAPHFR